MRGTVEQIAAIEIEESGGVVIARIDGEVDISNVDEVRQRLTAGVPNSALGLVVDLCRTAYLDSSGVSLLFELWKALERHRQSLRVVATEDTASGRVFLLTGMDKVIPMADTVAEARRAIAEGPRVGSQPSPG